MSVMESQTKRFIFIRWVARVWSIPAIFFAVNELFFPDAHQGVETNWFTWATVIVMFLSVVGLLIAWWYERLGGWASIGLLVVFLIFYWVDTAEFFPGWSWLLGFVALPAGLFLLSDFLNQP